MRYDDDEFDPDRRHRPPENPTSAGMIGFIAGMVALGLLVVVLVLYMLLNQDERVEANLERRRLLMYWFLILDVVAFLAGLVATIFSSFGLSPTNPLYRGWSILGLILGILEMVFTVGFGLFMTCVVLFVEMNRGP